MQYLRIISDLHLEFDIQENQPFYFPTPNEKDKDTILVIAGDLFYGISVLTDYHVKNQGKTEHKKSWLYQVSQQFGEVIVVLGNHDYWYNNMDLLPEQFQKELDNQKLNNVHLLQDNQIIINKTLFLGATLWTDYNKNDPMATIEARGIMPEFGKVTQGQKNTPVTTNDFLKSFNQSKQYIFSNAQKTEDVDNIVVVTHHSPSELSTDPRFKTPEAQQLNYAFYSNLEYDILDSDIDVWIHGHMHNKVDYTLGNTRIINNPRGYPLENNYNYNDNLILKLSQLKNDNKSVFKF